MSMSRVKKEQIEERDPFEEWRRIQLTPEQRTAARADLQKLIDAAAATGVYERLIELQGKVQLNLDLEELRRDRD